MAKLTIKQRDSLPRSDFAVPGGHYPVNDPNHARAALSMVSRYGSSLEKELVRRKVHEKYPNIGAK